jgi:hypothetical protein
MNNEKIQLTGLNAKWFDEAIVACLRHQNLLENGEGFSEYQFVHDMNDARVMSTRWSPTRKQFNLIREIARRFK